MNRSKSEALYKKSVECFPGGVNSPVRAFKSVEGTPIFIEEGKGSKITDVDGNTFIDYCCSWGPLILGHADTNVTTAIIETAKKGASFGAPTKLENDLGDLIISNHKYIDKIRFVSSGTEAVMSAIRLARGATGLNKIIKFEGCYHGHSDGLLVSAGSGLATFGTSSSDGVPESLIKETIVLPLNDKAAIDSAFENFEGDIAAIIIEPIPANNGLLLQDQAYLEYLREKCNKEGTLLIFDEVISGFRIGFEGAAAYYGIQPDIITFGKIIGGGMPVGAYASSNKIMAHISPEGGVYQAGTLSGNPVAMAAGVAQLKACLEEGFYEALEAKTNKLVTSLIAFAKENGWSFNIQHIGSLFWIAFSDNTEIKAASEIDGESMSLFKVLHKEMLERGIYLAPSGYEVGFMSAAHSDADVDETIAAFKESLAIVFA
jgi:glutamate-1-semialdehyde 2,1-aminomutase